MGCPPDLLDGGAPRIGRANWRFVAENTWPTDSDPERTEPSPDYTCGGKRGPGGLVVGKRGADLVGKRGADSEPVEEYTVDVSPASVLARRSMIRLCLVAVVLAATSVSVAQAEVFELRTYTTNDGKLDALHARFRDHTIKLFEKHGIKSVGYWVPTDGDEAKNTLIYVIEHKSRDAATASWKAFIDDPDWQKAFNESRKDGALVNKVESVFMEATDYSPTWKQDKSDDNDVFELRIYQAAEASWRNSTRGFAITRSDCSPSMASNPSPTGIRPTRRSPRTI